MPGRIEPEELARISAFRCSTPSPDPIQGKCASIAGPSALVVMAAEMRAAPYVIGEGGAWWVRPDHLPRWRELFEELFAPGS